MLFHEIDYKTLSPNPFVLLHENWAVVSAGNTESFNAMTIGWGTIGVMWHRPVVTIYIRPQRYTKKFIDKMDLFAVSFYSKEHKKALEVLGTRSGRDGDKITESALTPCFVEGTVTFEEADTVFVCKKLFGGQQLDASKFIDPKLDSRFYPDKDYSYIYFGEIEKVLARS